MSGAAEILVVILSIILVIFLVMGIVLTILMVKITKQIKNITASAERTAQNIETAVANVSRFSSPIAAMGLVGTMIKKFTKAKGKK